MKRFTMFLGLGSLVLSLAWVLAPGVAEGIVPERINIQGILRDVGGNPVADGSYSVIFTIYNADIGGSVFWAETTSIGTTDGLFNYRMGAANPIPDTAIRLNTWLGITVGADPEMTPRTRLTSVSHAFKVSTVQGAQGGVISGDVAIDTGNILLAGSGPDDILSLSVSDPNIALELRSGTFGGDPYIDFSNDAASDYDARIQLLGDAGLKIDVPSTLAIPTGKVGIGTTTPGSLPGILQNSRLEVADANGLNSDVSLRVSGGGATGSASLNFAKSRGTLPSPTSVQSGDFLGNITFVGHDGSDFGSIAAWIRGSVDGTPGVDDMPGRLEFLTTPDGSATPSTQMTINNAGKVGIGTTTPGSLPGILQNSRIEVADANGLNSDVSLRVSGGGATGSASLNFAKSRGTLSSPTIVQSGDLLGNMTFVGHDGSDFGSIAAWIRGVVDGTPGVDDMPGRLEFLTTPDGSATAATRMTIDNAGNVGIGTNTPSQKLSVNGNISGGSLIVGSTGCIDPSSGLQLSTSGDLITRTGSQCGGTLRLHLDGTTGNFGIATQGFAPVAPLEVRSLDATHVAVAEINRVANDGILIRFSRSGSTNVGNISVAAGAVSYNAFTGSHYGWTDEAIERGELVTLSGVNCNSHDNLESEIIYGIKRSSVPNDPACLGSFLALAEPSKPASTDNPHLVMAVGNGVMWVVDEGQNIQPGDYLISSSTPGHAMKDDETKYPIGHIVARAAEGVDWSTVSEMAGGHKHKKISVLFGNFVRSSVASVNRMLQQQQMEIEQLKETLKQMQAEKPQAKVE
ncbi:MAG: hypothetical protein L0196_05805 [candidate division Zixibacteria bacterium]|nr:hypothetical protein [candidate division Zixibacteria bacterium]